MALHIGSSKGSLRYLGVAMMGAKIIIIINLCSSNLACQNFNFPLLFMSGHWSGVSAAPCWLIHNVALLPPSGAILILHPVALKHFHAKDP